MPAARFAQPRGSWVRSIERLGRLDDGFPTRTICGAELQLVLGVAFDEQRDEVADRSSLEPGVLLKHDAIDLGRLNLLVGRGESAGELVDGLLFAQSDHANQCAAVDLTLSTARSSSVTRRCGWRFALG